MKIVVIGTGKIGGTILHQLSREEHEIVAIEQNEARIMDLQNSVDIICHCGNGGARDVQLRAGANEADLVIATTGNDEMNLVCCLTAKSLGAKNTIARIRKPEYMAQMNMFSDTLGLSMIINPDAAAAHEIFSVLRLPGLMSIEEFAHGRFDVAEFRLNHDSELTSMSLGELSRKHKVKALVCAVRRGDETIIPNGEFRLQKGDLIGFAAEPQEAEKLLHVAGVRSKMPKNVMICGAGKITHYIIRMMKKIGMKPTVIEWNEARGLDLAKEFPDVIIINGDATNRDLLVEEGIFNADAFVALTGNDEVNILLSMYANAQQVPKIITKVSRLSKLDIAIGERVDDLGSIVSPKDIIANRVVSYVRALEKATASNVETLYRIMDDSVEALEFKVSSDVPGIVGIPLKDMQLKKELLVCCVLRNNRIIIPNGNDTIEVGDSVVIVSTTKHFRDLKEILR